MSDRKKIILAIVGSLVLHLIIILGSSRVIALWPDASLSPQKEDLSPPQLTMLDTPPPEEQKEEKQERQYLRTNDDQKTDQKPVDSMFESDKDTAAASEQPAKGDAPIPTQEGKEAPDIGFKNESFSLADRGQAFSTDPGQQAGPPQKEEKQEEVKPVETPTATPKPEAKPSPAPTPTPAPTPEVAQADKEPTATPAPTPEVVPSDQQFAMLRPPPAQSPAPTPAATPTVEQPTPTPVPTPEEVFPTDEQLAMLRPTPTPRPTRVRQAERMPQRQSAPPTAYRQEQRITRMQGNINNRGRSSIAALGTPQGRFEKAVQDAIGSRWYFYVRERSDLINIGTVQIKFYVRPDGRVEDVKVLRNSSNETLASTSLQSIIEANIPPMPDELAPLLSGDRMEFTMSFNFTY
ncbi:MAG: energy transducer TonB [Verrucomicrobia bacterium]|nr:energy transducer TonB [Verrucomicrobiota bacterium]